RGLRSGVLKYRPAEAVVEDWSETLAAVLAPHVAAPVTVRWIPRNCRSRVDEPDRRGDQQRRSLGHPSVPVDALPASQGARDGDLGTFADPGIALTCLNTAYATAGI
ncbi:MAG TPA: hypothetical protein VII33_13745, partial [Nakamurella sp.]